ncbi:MAG: long-chain fatty acid ABC transporter [Geobacteraceae bacterium]|nr:long-chain fatty acid ABC transporter [Geobacteraceae bacterium]NTW79233.1 long-chain fatty acid ABC transporter [Geobacteraceae bacterium]
MKRKNIALTSLMLVLTSSSIALATNGDNTLGLTALEWARGGAIVASPVDIPSMMYNPAAAGEFKVNKGGFDMSLGLLNASRSIDTKTKSTDSDADNYLAMGVGAVARASDKMFFGIAAGGVAGLGVDFAGGTLSPATSVGVTTTKSLFKIAPTMAYVVNDKLTVGVSPQIGYQSMAMRTAQFTLPQTGVFGLGGSVGAIYHFTPTLQAGLSYTSKMFMQEYTFNGIAGATEGKYKMEMDVPQSVAGGVSFRPMPKLLLEADVKWIDFSDVMDRVELIGPAGAVAQTLAFGWKDQVVYSLGAEYEALPGLTLRSGYNYGASPIGKEDVTSNYGSIAVIEHHLSVGITKQWSPAVSTSASYTHGFSNKVTSNNAPAALAPVSIEATQNIAYAQLSFRF